MLNSASAFFIVKMSIPRKFWKKHVHPATKVFQALRIAVNSELHNIELFVDSGIKALNSGGILAAISFHSLEDRIVKHKFRDSMVKRINRNKYRENDKIVPVLLFNYPCYINS